MNITSALPAGMTIETLILLMAGMSALATCAAVWSTLLERDPGIKRAKVMAAQRDKLRAGLMAAPQRREKKTQSVDFMRRIVERFRLLKSGEAEKMSAKLMRAGMRSKDALIRYLFLKLALPFVFGGVAAVLCFGMNVWELEQTQQALVSGLAVLLGTYGPEIFLKNLIAKRMDRIRKTMPDAIDLMVICAEAGLSLDATMARVASEMASPAPDLSDELGLTSIELGFLPERSKALQNLAMRVDLPGMRGMVNSLLQAERYGTPLAHSLRVLSKEMRDERVLKAEEKAARLPALLTVPMILFILPPLFIVLVGPAGLDIVDAFASL